MLTAIVHNVLMFYRNKQMSISSPHPGAYSKHQDPEMLISLEPDSLGEDLLIECETVLKVQTQSVAGNALAAKD